MNQETSNGEAGRLLPAAPGSAIELLKPFFNAPIPTDRSSMADVIKNHLAQAAEKLGYRDGKAEVSVPPSEWCDDTDEVQTLMRNAWKRGFERGWPNAPASATGQEGEL